MLNEYLTIYAVGDNLAYHFISNKKAELGDNKYINFIEDPEKFNEAEKKIYNIMITTHNLISKLSDPALEVVKNKYQKILNGFALNKMFNQGFIPVFIGLVILELYANYKGKKIYKIQPKTVKKTIENIRKVANISILDKAYLNSLAIGEKIFYIINPGVKIDT
jgi:hypothetical protein